MNNIKTHTRNQKRMYRIHKQEEKIKDYELLIGKLQQELTDYKERNEKAKIKISELMSKYFYEKDFCIEDTDLDTILQILDKKEASNDTITKI